MKDNLPSISIIIPTLNEEKNIENCLRTISNQDYPHDLVEIIIVDNYSKDRTVDLAKKFNAKIIYNKVKDPEKSKMIGLRQATKELFLYLDADIELVGSDWLNKLIQPLIDDQNLVGSFPRFVPKKSDVAIARYLRFHPLEIDPLIKFFCREIKDTVIKKEKGYWICKFDPVKLPPIGICAYRKGILEKILHNMDKFMDIDVPVMLAEKGYDTFAHVPDCGIYHTNVTSLKEILQKRKRNLDEIFLPNISIRKYKFFDLKDKKDILKIFGVIIYANTLILPFGKGLYKSLKFRDIACLYEPVVMLALTDYIIYRFLINKQGRKIIAEKIFNKSYH